MFPVMTDVLLGHTQSGKPVREKAETPDFTAQDHYDADQLHAHQLGLWRAKEKLALRDRELGIERFDLKGIRARIRHHRAACQRHLHAAAQT